MKEPSRVRVAGPLQPFARGFGEHLMRQGYTRLSAVAQLQLMAQVSRWMAEEAGVEAGAVERSPLLRVSRPASAGP